MTHVEEFLLGRPPMLTEDLPPLLFVFLVSDDVVVEETLRAVIKPERWEVSLRLADHRPRGPSIDASIPMMMVPVLSL